MIPRQCVPEPPNFLALFYEFLPVLGNYFLLQLIYLPPQEANLEGNPITCVPQDNLLFLVCPSSEEKNKRTPWPFSDIFSISKKKEDIFIKDKNQIKPKWKCCDSDTVRELSLEKLKLMRMRSERSCREKTQTVWKRLLGRECLKTHSGVFLPSHCMLSICLHSHLTFLFVTPSDAQPCFLACVM